MHRLIIPYECIHGEVHTVIIAYPLLEPDRWYENEESEKIFFIEPGFILTRTGSSSADDH